MSRSNRVVAFKRLLQEYKALTADAPEGIVAGPRDEDDYFTWVAMFSGPEGTPFEGGVFEAELKFPEDYPLKPPEMRFLDKMWHPNGKLPRSHRIHRDCSTNLLAHSLSRRQGLHLHSPSGW